MFMIKDTGNNALYWTVTTKDVYKPSIDSFETNLCLGICYSLRSWHFAGVSILRVVLQANDFQIFIILWGNKRPVGLYSAAEF